MTDFGWILLPQPESAIVFYMRLGWFGGFNLKGDSWKVGELGSMGDTYCFCASTLGEWVSGDFVSEVGSTGYARKVYQT